MITWQIRMRWLWHIASPVATPGVLDSAGRGGYPLGMSETIAVIGDGGMGTICAIMLAENGHEVRLWSAFADQAREMREAGENRRFLPGATLPEGICITADDAEALDGVSWIVSAVPTPYLREVWQRLAPLVPHGAAVLSVTKGIENDTLLRPTEVIEAVSEIEPMLLSALSGPSIAPEIAQRKPASVSVAAHQEGLADRAQQLINRPYFRVYSHGDLPGLEIAGATKNVIAIAAGVLDGLDTGDNAKAALLARGLSEIARLGEAMGAQAETFFGLAGVGDLVTTCISPVGRNRSFGEAVGKGTSPQEVLDSMQAVVEGVRTTRSVVALAEKHDVDMPITRAVHAVLFEDKAPREAIHELMTRPLRREDIA